MTKVDVFEPKEDTIKEKEEHLSSSDPIKLLLNDLEINSDQQKLFENYVKHVENLPFIQEYIDNTIGPTHTYFNLTVLETFEINRPEDLTNFRKDLHNRRFLWHGTKKENIASIIQNGFKLNFARLLGLFGKGIYFSDCSTKSLNFCHNNLTAFSLFDFSKTNTYYLFLCEVALGEMKTCDILIFNSKNILNEGKNSVFGKGQWAPLEKELIYDENDVMICVGKLKKRQEYQKLMYNEFVVYDTNQIKLKYLVKIQSNHTAFQVFKRQMRVFINMSIIIIFYLFITGIVFYCRKRSIPLSLFEYSIVFIILFFAFFVLELIKRAAKWAKDCVKKVKIN